MSDPDVRLRRFRALPGLFAEAPTWLVATVGAALVVLGALIAVRPLTSLWVLAVYAGASCILSGVAELVRGRRPGILRMVVGVVWIVVGIALIAWLGVSIALLPIVMAALLVVGGLSDLPRLRQGPLSARVLTAAWILAQIAFGVLALLWPDLTSVTVAVLFGLRAVVFGLTLLWRALAPWRRRLRATRASRDPAPRGRIIAAAVGRWVAALLVVAVSAGAWMVSLDLRAGLPVVDAFYSTPAEVPDAPGALLRADAWPGTAPAGAHVERILYTTTDLHGAPAVASAIVVIPDTLPDGQARVVLWDHGTTGIARDCAPSLMMNMFDIQGIPAVAQAVSAGWVIVATDYSGQGAAGDFPYLIGQGEARSTLDAFRAARHLDGLDLPAEAVVWEHSQGGHAALWTGALAAEYAPELHILGVAAVSPAADPRGLAQRIIGAAGSSPVTTLAVAWVLIPYSQAYDDVDFAAQVAPAGRAIVREMSARCASQPGLLVSVLSAIGVGSGDRLYLGDLTGGVLGARLDDNKTLGPWGAPLLIAWGGSDEVIAPALQHDYVGELCAAGVDLTSHEYPGLSHMGVVTEGSGFLPLLVSWTADRFAGRAAPPSTC